MLAPFYFEFKPIAAEIDENEIFPEKNIEALEESGVLGIAYPEEYGGVDIHKRFR